MPRDIGSPERSSVERNALSLWARLRRYREKLSLLAVAASCSAVAAGGLDLLFPDPSHTPGALNPEVTQDTLQQTVCQRGWTATIQPPASYLDRLKAKQVKALHLKGTPKDYYADHLIPLCAGGHP